MDAKAKVMLLIEVGRRLMIPIRPSALVVGQGSQDWLNKKSKGALIFDGHAVRRIDHVDVIGYYNNCSILSFISSFITGTKRINVCLSEPLPYDLGELKSVLIQFLLSNCEVGWLDNPSECARVAQSIGCAKSFTEIFECLEFPDEEDCLDIL